MGILIKIDGVDFSANKIGEVALPACNHVYGAGEVTLYATCEDDGLMAYTCSKCGDIKNEVIPATGHTYVDGACSICGARDPGKPYEITEYPVQDGLQGLYDLGGTAEETVVNHALSPTYLPDGGVPALAGTYAVEDNYVTFSGNANASRMHTYLRLPLTSDGLTVVTLFSIPSATSTLQERALISNRNASSGFALRNGSVMFGKDSVTQTPKFDNNVVVGTDSFAILAMTLDANGCRVVRYSNGAINSVFEHTDGVDAWTNNAIQIGGDGTGTPYADANISLAAIHTGVLTDEQLEEICEFVYEYGTKTKGLTIE